MANLPFSSSLHSPSSNYNAWEYLPKGTRALTIASHVSHGYVGNKVVSLVLQSAGFDVAEIHTVCYSNHVAYGLHHGRVTQPDEIRELFSALHQLNLDNFNLLLTGYTSTVDNLNVILEIAQSLRQSALRDNRPFYWILDPVLGDNNRLYVNSSLINGYLKMLPYADLILPNLFELSVLTGHTSTLTSTDQVLAAIDHLHRHHSVKSVLVTSAHVNDTPPSDLTSMSVIGSTCRSDGSSRTFRITFPALPCTFSGTGDLFASLIAIQIRLFTNAYHYQRIDSLFNPTDNGSTGSSVSTDPIKPASQLAESFTDDDATDSIEEIDALVQISDDVTATRLPLAYAACAALHNMELPLIQTFCKATLNGARTAFFNGDLTAKHWTRSCAYPTNHKLADLVKSLNGKYASLSSMQDRELQVISCVNSLRNTITPQSFHTLNYQIEAL